MSQLKNICVVGAGQMGKQIALKAALCGFQVFLTDSFPAAVETAKVWSVDYLSKRVAKGKLFQEDASSAQNCFHVVSTLEEAAKDADLVIEAIIEKRSAKEELFRSLDQLVRADTLLTTNSSNMVSSLFADCVQNPGRLANLHYFNPPLHMKLVEIVRGPHTSDETVSTLYQFVKDIGKIPVLVQKEIEGFVVNYISNRLTLSALELASMGVATPQDIDLALENGLNHPMGPFRLMDLTGIDLAYMVMTDMENRGEHHPGYELVKAKYEAGEYGRKTGKGWYTYQDQ